MLLGPNKQKPGRARAGWRNGTRGYQYAVNTHKKAIRHKTTVMALTVMTFLYERKSACRCSSSFAAFSAFLTPYTKHTNHDPQAVKLEVLISLLMLVFPCQEGSTHFATPQRSFLSKEEGVRGGGGLGGGLGSRYDHELQHLWFLQPILAPHTMHRVTAFKSVPCQSFHAQH